MKIDVPIADPALPHTDVPKRNVWGRVRVLISSPLYCSFYLQLTTFYAISYVISLRAATRVYFRMMY